MIRMYWCLIAPWHKFRVVGRPSGEWSAHIRCSCGREYGVNDDARTILPWSCVAEFYREVYGYPKRGPHAP